MNDERKERAEKMRDDIALRWVKVDRAGKQKKEYVDSFRAWRNVPENAAAFNDMQKLDLTLSEISNRPAIAALRAKVLSGSGSAFKQNHSEVEKKEIDTSGGLDRLGKVVQIGSFVNKEKFQRVKTISAAAVAIAASFLFFWVAPYWQNIHQTEVGEVRSLVLQDNTEVILDTGSKIRVAYKDNERRIYLLKGQAYFDVTSMPERPFIVRAGEKNVIAVGTAFAVKYDKLDTLVLLQEGKVNIEKNRPSEKDKPVQLEAGQQWRSTRGEGGEKSDVSDMDSLLDWTGGRLVFQSETLGRVISEVNRYSEAKIKINSEEILNEKVDAVYQIGKTDTFVKGLSGVMGFDFISDAEGNIVILGEGE